MRNISCKQFYCVCVCVRRSHRIRQHSSGYFVHLSHLMIIIETAINWCVARQRPILNLQNVQLWLYCWALPIGCNNWIFRPCERAGVKVFARNSLIIFVGCVRWAAERQCGGQSMLKNSEWFVCIPIGAIRSNRRLVWARARSHILSCVGELFAHLPFEKEFTAASFCSCKREASAGIPNKLFYRYRVERKRKKQKLKFRLQAVECRPLPAVWRNHANDLCDSVQCLNDSHFNCVSAELLNFDFN